MTICAGCVSVPVDDGAALRRLAATATPHAAALAGDDIDRMRSTGRALIAQIDAALAPPRPRPRP